MADTFARFTGSGSSLTYIIVDLPVVSAIQWMFLSIVRGEERVNVVADDDSEVKPGMFNMVPVSRLDKVGKPDLFLSTWAISESSSLSQDQAIARGLFDAPHLLLAYQRSDVALPYADRVGELASTRGARIEEMPLQAGHFYAFK